jgi:hypothetical protein
MRCYSIVFILWLMRTHGQLAVDRMRGISNERGKLSTASCRDNHPVLVNDVFQMRRGHAGINVLARRLVHWRQAMAMKATFGTHGQNDASWRLALIALVTCCGLVSSCRTATVLTDAALYSCGTSTVYLNGWWASIHDQSGLEFDPIGGYQFTYWVDEAGNACHGDPGRNGQVGPAVLQAFKVPAYQAANSGSATTAEQLKSFQEIPVAFDKYSGSGMHFVQFLNKFKRSRADGKVDRVDDTFSVPIIVDVGSKACVAPVAFRVNFLAVLPGSPNTASGQDPTRCRVRAFPIDSTMTEENRKKYHVVDLPHGKDIFEVP